MVDIDVIFDKKVVIPYKIDEILTPNNLGNGEIENASISDLRKELDNCFIEIEGYTLKEKLIDYIEDYSIQLRLNITSKKRLIKRLKNSTKSINSRHPDLDINNINDEQIISEINNQEWLISQEDFILMYLKEQQFFIRQWAGQKRVEYNDLPEKERKRKHQNRKETSRLIKKLNIVIEKNEYPKIFLNAKAFKIFDEFQKGIIKYHLAEYSFIYRIMKKNGLIHNSITNATYKKWLEDQFEITIEKVKTFNTVNTDSRLKAYRALLKLYKPL